MGYIYVRLPITIDVETGCLCTERVKQARQRLLIRSKSNNLFQAIKCELNF